MRSKHIHKTRFEMLRFWRTLQHIQFHCWYLLFIGFAKTQVYAQVRNVWHVFQKFKLIGSIADIKVENSDVSTKTFSDLHQTIFDMSIIAKTFLVYAYCMEICL